MSWEIDDGGDPCEWVVMGGPGDEWLSCINCGATQDDVPVGWLDEEATA